MGQKIVVGPFNKGLTNNVEPFIIDNDSFPVLKNSYQWRGRIKRKRGTSFLNRLTRYFDSTSESYIATASSTITLSGGEGNLITGFSLESSSSLVLGSISILDTNDGQTYTDPASDGILTGDMAGTGTINYTSGIFSITSGAAHVISANFRYYPCLPVLGLRSTNVENNQFPNNLSFDNKHSYKVLTTSPYNVYDVSFYKNPTTATYTNYVAKSVITPITWNGQDYQNFWSVNYEGAVWVTNGINIPFSPTNIGMQFSSIENISNLVAGPPATIDVMMTGHQLQVGDFLFFNEINEADIQGLNFQTGYVTTRIDDDNVTVTLPNATLAGVWGSTAGISQYLTARKDTTLDGIRWYDGDPTNGNATSPTLNGRLGWVNFSPPLSQSNFSIGELPEGQYYLVGCRKIIPFKDRLVFFSVVVQTSTGDKFYLQDMIVFSWNGTHFYTASFTGDVDSTSTVFNPILTPANKSGSPTSYFTDSTGFGGFLPAGINEPLNTAEENDDMIVCGFSTKQYRLAYTSNDILPFQFYQIDNELGSSSTFSSVGLGESILSRGSRGIIATNQLEASRIDMSIPDEVFQMKLSNHGAERIIAIRDFINEWVYFTYSANNISYKFPTRTLFFNYLDQSWAIFDECYTSYGEFSKVTGYTWATIGSIYPTWSVWNDPWNSGASTLLQPEIIGGNQQGFILIRSEGTGEGKSIKIKNISFPSTITGASQAINCVLTSSNSFVAGEQLVISGVTGMTELNGNTYTIVSATSTTITLNVDSTLFGVYAGSGTATPTDLIYSPNHCLNDGDFVIFDECIGTISSQTNGNIFQVSQPTDNSFEIIPNLITSGTYLGGGTIKRMYRPFIQTKQFPVAWGMGRKTRLGVQQYLFTTTSSAQIQLLIYRSQDSNNPYNDTTIVPDQTTDNPSLIYSSVLYTCPESTNLGLTPENANLNQIGATSQSQIWHRKNTSVVGDTVQIGFTLSDDQMRDITKNYQFAEIELHGFILDVNPSQLLS